VKKIIAMRVVSYFENEGGRIDYKITGTVDQIYLHVAESAKNATLGNVRNVVKIICIKVKTKTTKKHPGYSHENIVAVWKLKRNAIQIINKYT